MRSGALTLLLFWSLWPIHGFAADKCDGPIHQVALSRRQAVRVIAKEKGYTEGLIFSQGILFESLGLYGQSSVRRIDPYTGMSQTLRTLEGRYFGEGLTEVNGQLVQLTYKENTAFIYGKTDKAIVHNGEAWGLTKFGDDLIQSDGTSVLKILDPETLKVRRSVKVRHGKRKIHLLNELESAHDKILANILGSDWVAIINPTTGCLEGTIDLSALRTPETNDITEAKCAGRICVEGDFALNGIAYDEGHDEIYFTGKNWPYIFVFKFPK
jgi:glutaminyl-peptide cyclotransferase